MAETDVEKKDTICSVLWCELIEFRRDKAEKQPIETKIMAFIDGLMVTPFVEGAREREREREDVRSDSITSPQLL